MRGHRAMGAVAAEHDDQRDFHPVQVCSAGLRVGDGIGDRQVDEFDFGPALVRRDRTMRVERAQQQRRDARPVSQRQHALDAHRAEAGQQAHDHVRFLGRREHGCMRRKAANVAPRGGVRDYTDGNGRRHGFVSIQWTGSGTFAPAAALPVSSAAIDGRRIVVADATAPTCP